MDHQKTEFLDLGFKSGGLTGQIKHLARGTVTERWQISVLSVTSQKADYTNCTRHSTVHDIEPLRCRQHPCSPVALRMPWLQLSNFLELTFKWCNNKFKTATEKIVEPGRFYNQRELCNFQGSNFKPSPLKEVVVVLLLFLIKHPHHWQLKVFISFSFTDSSVFRLEFGQKQMNKQKYTSSELFFRLFAS